MKRLSYSQLFASLRDYLLQENFERAGGEIFTGLGPSVISPWISLAGTEYAFAPVLGGFSKTLDRLVGRALKSTFPKFVVGKFAVPLFRISPEKVSPEDPRLIGHRTASPGYSQQEVDAFAEWLEQVGLPFLSQHSTFKLALDLALRYNREDQAQQYYIPALMLALGLRTDKENYVAETIGRYEPRALELIDSYRNFILNLDMLMPEEFPKAK